MAGQVVRNYCFCRDKRTFSYRVVCNCNHSTHSHKTHTRLERDSDNVWENKLPEIFSWTEHGPIPTHIFATQFFASLAEHWRNPESSRNKHALVFHWLDGGILPNIQASVLFLFSILPPLLLFLFRLLFKPNKKYLSPIFGQHSTTKPMMKRNECMNRKHSHSHWDESFIRLLNTVVVIFVQRNHRKSINMDLRFEERALDHKIGRWWWRRTKMLIFRVSLPFGTSLTLIRHQNHFTMITHADVYVRARVRIHTHTLIDTRLAHPSKHCRMSFVIWYN